MNPVNVEDPDAPQEPMENRSTFMVNIGTHRLPLSLYDWAEYKKSLSTAIKNVLSRPTIFEEVFDYNYSERGTRARDLDLMPALGFTPIASHSRFVVERGTKTGRVDAHILIDVRHRDRIQFNVPRFRSLLDNELIVRNRVFIQEDIKSTEDGDYLKWPPPNSYVSVRLIGSIGAVDAERYIKKSIGDRRVYPGDERAERNLRAQISSVLNAVV